MDGALPLKEYMDIKQKVKDFLFNLNEKGIAIPLLRDPIKDSPSVSLTLLVISGTTVFVGLIGKWSNALGNIDISQSLNWFLVCSGLYFGRSLSKENNKVSSDKEKEE